MAVRLPVEFWLRPRYLTPATRLLPATDRMTVGPMTVPSRPGPAGWVLGNHLVDGTGSVLSAAREDQVTRSAHAAADPTAYLRGLGLRVEVVYQPAGRFWVFQVIEVSLFIGLAAVLLGVAILLLRRRGT